MKAGEGRLDYMIGVDGGGTKTEAVAFRLNGEEAGRGISGFGNVLIDYREATAHIIEAIRQSQQGLEPGKCLCIYLGLAGIESADPEPLTIKLTGEFRTKVKIVNDAVIAHAALLKGNEGILTIAGTGSICIGKYRSRYDYAGGWGHLLGDEGSGYWISLQALKQMAIESDAGLPPGPLSRALLKELQLKQVKEIKRFVYSSTKDEMAALVPCIVNLANGGDGQALFILNQAGEELANLTGSLYKKLGFPQNVQIALKGGILQSIPYVQDSFTSSVKQKIQRARFVTEDVSSAKGAFYLAMQEMNDQ